MPRTNESRGDADAVDAEDGDEHHIVVLEFGKFGELVALRPVVAGENGHGLVGDHDAAVAPAAMPAPAAAEFALHAGASDVEVLIGSPI